MLDISINPHVSRRENRAGMPRGIKKVVEGEVSELWFEIARHNPDIKALLREVFPVRLSLMVSQLKVVRLRPDQDECLVTRAGEASLSDSLLELVLMGNHTPSGGQCGDDSGAYRLRVVIRWVSVRGAATEEAGDGGDEH